MTAFESGTSFFFQAEDGIRDTSVTGVQTCALPILLDDVMHELKEPDREAILLRYLEGRALAEVGKTIGLTENAARMRIDRSEERRVGKECRLRWTGGE